MTPGVGQTEHMAYELEWLADASNTTEPQPFAGPDHPMRKMTRRVAFEREWDDRNVENVGRLFDELADGWAARADEEGRVASIADALDRGGAPLDGAWLELGSGTGMGTSVAAERVGSIVATDLSWEMLVRAPSDLAPRVRADAARLPFRQDQFDGLLLVNMLLFPAEADRVLRPDGALVWVNTVGDQTPIHLPPDDVLEALPGAWRGTAGRAGTGLWVVATRA